MEASQIDLTARRYVALARIQALIAARDARARLAWRCYYVAQTATVALAAITPCLIFLAKENPHNDILTWLQLFFPAVAAITAGASHIFHWREDGVRSTSLGESLRSELWRFETRAGDYGLSLTEDQALDHLVTRVDDLNLHTVAQWATDRLAPPAEAGTKPAVGASAASVPAPAAKAE